MIEKRTSAKKALKIPKLVSEVMIVESTRINQNDGHAIRDELLKR
jgi:hypothetical protein